ncbi:hypothetical protein AsAng_0025110 [Aureispira anguillae]|uniref:Uncharacterized protein n=1 Tax=Aureispira anguillae TaxID=2864201 RepID=A0A915YEY4_9BACT|nr:hypothetical protein AsAng_0025110 [Aureispira anguillae]
MPKRRKTIENYDRKQCFFFILLILIIDLFTLTKELELIDNQPSNIHKKKCFEF